MWKFDLWWVPRSGLIFASGAEGVSKCRNKCASQDI